MGDNPEAESMHASREHATQGIQDKLYSRKQFSAAKVKMYIMTEGKCVEESTVAATGAATEIIAECKLNSKTMSTCDSSRAMNLRNASGGSMGSKGEVMVAFTLGDCPFGVSPPIPSYDIISNTNHTGVRVLGQVPSLILFCNKEDLIDSGGSDAHNKLHMWDREQDGNCG